MLLGTSLESLSLDVESYVCGPSSGYCNLLPFELFT